MTKMQHAGRNDPCPCGSGKKYKKCCLVKKGSPSGSAVSRVTSKLGHSLDEPTRVLQARAYGFYQAGYFLDCVEVCEELQRRNGLIKSSIEVWYLAALSLANDDMSLYRITSIDAGGVPNVQLKIGGTGVLPLPLNEHASPTVSRELSGSYPVESLYLLLRDVSVAPATKMLALEKVRKTLSENLWIVPSAHPTVALHVADWLVVHDMREDFARELICCCIGWRYSYNRIDDLLRLAHLLDHFCAPKFIWIHLMDLYGDFAFNDDLRRSLMREYRFSETVEPLDRGEVNWKEGLFHRFCASHGLPEHDEISDLLYKELGAEKDENCNPFPGSGNYIAGPYQEWLTEEAFQMRHPWFCLLEQYERNFVRNADTAFATCITDDYSFACAQWWRCIESVLRRRLVVPVGNLIDANPDWLKEDLADPELTKRESLFVKELASPAQRQKMSLTPMLYLLEGCLSDCREKKESNSVVRRKTVEYVVSRLSEFKWLNGEYDHRDNDSDFRSFSSSKILSEDKIRLFRNGTSHDKPMTFAQAAVGRLIAIRILDFMHYPKYCTVAKLNQLIEDLREDS